MVRAGCSGIRRFVPGLALALLIVIPSVLGAVPVAQTAPWGVWRVETAYAGFSGPIPTSIDLDSKGQPHILFTGEGARYAWKTGAFWQVEVIQSPGGGDSIKLDQDDRPHALVADLQYLWYAIRTDNGWKKEVIDTPPPRSFAMGQVLDFDSAGAPHVATAFSRPGYGFNYYRATDSGWVREVINTAHVGWFGFALDQEGRAHVAYIVVGEGMTFRYAMRDHSGVWQEEFVHGCYWDISLAIDSQGHPHVSCYARDIGLMHHHRTSTGWTSQLVDDRARPVLSYPSSYIGHESSIAVDSKDQPHISYRIKYDLGWPDNPLYPGQLHYAARVNGLWFVERVDPDGQANGYFSNIVLDDQDRPHISSILGWRSWSRPGPQELNPSFQLRYATPLTSVASPFGL